jgi:YfiH family protein
VKNPAAESDFAGRLVTETATHAPPGFTHPEWRDRFPWLVQGTTSRNGQADPFDLGIFSVASSARDVMENWEELRRAAGLPVVVHARQVHGAQVRVHTLGPAGLHLMRECDGHATFDPGVLLTVTTADCVPVSIVDPVRQAVAMLHAGWRGTAFGILERGIETLAAALSVRADLHLHLGPAICGGCYEVGPEVFEALKLPAPSAAEPVDLRRLMARRACDAGVSPENITISTFCTLCDGAELFSHRGGDRGRQVGYLGMRL